MRKVIYILFFLQLIPACILAQDLKFHKASDQYINNDLTGAIASVNEGLKEKPGDPKLQALKKLLEKKEQEKKEQEKKDQQKKEEQKKEDQKKDNKDQKNKDQKEEEKKEEEKKSEEQKEKEKKEQEQKDNEKKDSEKDQDKKDEQKDQQQKEDEEQQKGEKTPPQVSEKLKQMKMPEDKAKMILEAMKNQEAQYLQQNKRKATKPRDKGKPDW
jgi:hypothetical protein